MYQTEIFNAPSELERLLWTIDKGTENYYRREGSEDFGCVTMKFTGFPPQGSVVFE